MKTKTKNLKMILIAGIVLFAAMTSVFAQTNNTKQVLPEFNSIVISSPMDLTLSQGTESSISIGEGDVQDKLKAEVKGNVLYLKGKPADDITINFTKLNKIELLSECDVKSSNQISSDKLEVYLKGAGDIDLNLNVKDLITSIAGAGDIKYEGTAETHLIEIKGAGDVNAYKLAANSTNVVINGAGDVKVNVKQDLKGTINGTGDITYLNEPVTKDIKVNGFGSYGLKGDEKMYLERDTVGFHSVAVGDTNRFHIGNQKFTIISEPRSPKDTIRDTMKKKDKFKIYWSGIGLGFNGYLNADNHLTVPPGYGFLDLKYPNSLNVSLNFWEQKIPIWKRHINIVTGMGLDINNYKFTSINYKLQANSSCIWPPVYDSTITFTKNKLTASYLNIPLLLQFDTNPIDKRTIHVSAGVVGGIRIGSHTKQIYEIDGKEHKSKIRDDFNLNPFRYSAMVRLGYGNIDVYASYSLNTLFKKNEGPQLYPFTVGITLKGV